MCYTEAFYKDICTVLGRLPSHTEISFAITDEDETSYYGLRKDENEISYPINSSSAFEIGSVTKSFTGNILTNLAVENKINLDAQLSDFLSFKLKGNPPITLKHLAMHTSGLPRMPIGYDERNNFIRENPFINYKEDELISYLEKELVLESFPGEKVSYSNLGYAILGQIIAKIEGQSLPDVMRKRIFDVLEMRNSVFNIDGITAKLIKGLDKEGNFTPYWNSGIFNGSLGVISTAEDLNKFAKNVLNPANKVTDLQIKNSIYAKPNVYSAIGWVLVKTSGSSPILKINGGTAGFACSIFLNRKNQKALSFCSNIHPDTYMEWIEPLCAMAVK
ncbi:serine hydrolase domain-containing protein [Chryseobacterium sp.]|uniref:serine hydrolase domain-containing protein n=1 Tax=Chryseobacterium sp. TaxID=1871047 RepID=UPI003340AF8C